MTPNKRQDVVAAYQRFLEAYDEFRKANDLAMSKPNPYEMCTSVADKLGRICRQIKHFERNDPKTDWPEAVSEEVFGCMVYLIMLANKYGIDLPGGAERELDKATSQHSKRKTT